MVVGLIAAATRAACRLSRNPSFYVHPSRSSARSCVGLTTDLEGMMALYEFRLLDAGGKLTGTRECNYATMQEAISISVTLPIPYRFVEIWSGGKVIGRMPKR